MRGLFAFMLAVTLFCACSSTPSDRPAGLILKPEGGEIGLPGGGSLVVPPGAVGADMAITVTQIAPPDTTAFVPVGTFLRFEPSGLTFLKPLTLRLKYQLPPGVAANATVRVV